MTSRGSIPSAYFDALYAEHADPWRFASSEYERAKYDATIAAIPSPELGAVFEVGCSIGVLTRRLAGSCVSLLAVDVAEAALAAARTRCAGVANVSVRKMRIPDAWPDGMFDLILFSEVLYYLSPDDIARTARLTRGSLSPRGTALLVHYILPTDYPCSGDEATAIFMAHSGLTPTLQRREPDYRLDVLRT